MAMTDKQDYNTLLPSGSIPFIVMAFALKVLVPPAAAVLRDNESLQAKAQTKPLPSDSKHLPLSPETFAAKHFTFRDSRFTVTVGALTIL